jgi:hypothetical protein
MNQIDRYGLREPTSYVLDFMTGEEIEAASLLGARLHNRTYAELRNGSYVKINALPKQAAREGLKAQNRNQYRNGVFGYVAVITAVFAFMWMIAV